MAKFKKIVTMINLDKSKCFCFSNNKEIILSAFYFHSSSRKSAYISNSNIIYAKEFHSEKKKKQKNGDFALPFV